MTEFRTDDVPSTERFDLWYDSMTRSVLPFELRSDHRDDFRASGRALDLGPVQISTGSHPPLEALRTPSVIRRFGAENHQILLAVEGDHWIAQDGREAVIRPGELVHFDTARPWHGRAYADRHPIREVLVTFPRALLPFPDSSLARLSARRVPGREGMGALLSTFLTQALANAAHYRETDIGRLAKLTIDHLTAWYAHLLGAEDEVPPETGRTVLRRRIHLFIERNLGDPGLTPAAIAAAHHISLRRLHQLFNEQGRTVAAHIRERRLERCHRDLADPGLLRHPVRSIAARWGFTDAAHFSRVFRSAFGISPGAYRHLAMRQGRPPGTEDDER
ncbi:helix-turn-helix domain-containing protein [Streptomyces sp. URMC 129]|uniref:helix-turn-helix domain-containing protein n=1 Tax=Streptomyces sp. URMC 129 TaxID=3423407 RepID=UPI003F1D41BB